MASRAWPAEFDLANTTSFSQGWYGLKLLMEIVFSPQTLSAKITQRWQTSAGERCCRALTRLVTLESLTV